MQTARQTWPGGARARRCLRAELTSGAVGSHAEDKIPDDWKLTVELVQPGTGAKVAADHVPIGGLYPPKDWRTGEFVVDEHRIHIDSHVTRPGHYEVWLGFRSRRGPVGVDTDLPTDARRRVKLGDVHVAATE